MNSLTQAIRDDTPLALDYDGSTFALGDLFLGTLHGKPAFAWTASGWGFDSGPPCHALQADLQSTEAGDRTEWEDRARGIVIGRAQGYDKAAIEQWHKIANGGNRAERRADALRVIIDYNPTFEPDPEP